MYCSKCGNELKEDEKFCSKCGTSTDSKKVKSIKSKKSIVIAVICVIAVILAVLLIKNNGTGQNGGNGFIQTSANIKAIGAEKISFENMSGDEESLTDIQKNIVKYFNFGDDYFKLNNQLAQKYPQVYENAKVYPYYCYIAKVLKSNDTEFEAVAVCISHPAYAESYYGQEIDEIAKYSEQQLIVISGEQMQKRLVKGDIIDLKGRYKGTKDYAIDGKTYVLPNLTIINAKNVFNELGETNYEDFDYDTIKGIAEYIFGKDIKVLQDEDYDFGYRITLDNQSNANFKEFRLFKTGGDISYINEDKHLYISADFNHFIVNTYDENTKHIYIEYFDKDFQKLWSREFNYTSKTSIMNLMDYTTDTMAIIVDNDLYLIDLKNGENIIEPIMVGEKIDLKMMSDGVILIGNNDKDSIMKVDYKGNILYKNNVETSIIANRSCKTQVVNGKLIILLSGDSDRGPLEKYIVLNNDGSIECATEEMAGEI